MDSINIQFPVACNKHLVSNISQQTPYVEPMLGYSWTSVADDGPMLA